MAIPIMRAISAALLVVLLASALQPGLMAAPLSPVAVPTPPIEQNITRRDQVDVHLYAVRMSRNHHHELVAGGNVLQPDEWIQIGVVDPIGGEQLLQYIHDRTLANEWIPVVHVHPLNPNNIPAQLKFPIGTVHCSSVEVRNQLFGFPFHKPPILGLIHQPFRVLYQIGDPETSVDLSLAARAHADKIANILLERDDVDFARHINTHGFTYLVSYMAHRVNFNAGQEWQGDWDTRKLRDSREALREANAWEIPEGVEVQLPNYYRLKTTER
ncbi:hypothetical protein C8R42DRAFT_39289 [Lentinula raphanica]|nr:hypothetical protein C8R42DRAFT_39289 [Lentinula raphanica]